MWCRGYPRRASAPGSFAAPTQAPPASPRGSGRLPRARRGDASSWAPRASAPDPGLGAALPGSRWEGRECGGASCRHRGVRPWCGRGGLRRPRAMPSATDHLISAACHRCLSDQAALDRVDAPSDGGGRNAEGLSRCEEALATMDREQMRRSSHEGSCGFIFPKPYPNFALTFRWNSLCVGTAARPRGPVLTGAPSLAG